MSEVDGVKRPAKQANIHRHCSKSFGSFMFSSCECKLLRGALGTDTNFPFKLPPCDFLNTGCFGVTDSKVQCRDGQGGPALW